MKNSNALPVGSVLNSGSYQYRVIKVLGSGGFGITYLVTSARKIGNITVNVKFAIKEHFLSEYCERDSDTLRIITGLGRQRETVDNSMKDFLGEARRLQMLSDGHSSIVKVNEVFEANGTAYYVMEYLEGKSLRAYIAEHGPLSENDALRLMAPIVEAVDYLHSCRLTHLDIKPDNIIITEEENGDGKPVVRPVLIDFGLSKHYDKSGNATSTINTLGCSDGYVPVEQYAGITKFSPEADVYALAATLLFCLTSKNPKKSTELIYLNLHDYLVEAVPGMSPTLESVLSKSFSAIPSDRPVSLSGFINGEVSHKDDRYTPIDTPANESKKEVTSTAKTTLLATPSRRRPVLYIAIIGAVITGVICLIFMTRGRDTKEDILASAINDSIESVADTISAVVTNPTPDNEPEATKEPQDKKPDSELSESEILKEAKAAYNKRNYDKAFSLFSKISNNPIAENYLGEMYWYGNGVVQSYTESAKWHRKSAEQGNALGQLHIGLMYSIGTGVAKDKTEAAKWFRKSAEQGNADAQYHLGTSYHWGQGVALDYNEAAKWYRKSAEQGNYNAVSYLYTTYLDLEHQGETPDYSDVLKWSRNFAEQGDSDAQLLLALMYERGQGVPRDSTEAIKWYRKSANQGNGTAKWKLEKLNVK